MKNAKQQEKLELKKFGLQITKIKNLGITISNKLSTWMEDNYIKTLRETKKIWKMGTSLNCH